jgi:hypothetical protein
MTAIHVQPLHKIEDLIQQGYMPTNEYTQNYSFAWLQKTLERINISYSDIVVFNTVNGWQIFTTSNNPSPFGYESLLPVYSD